MGSGKNSNSELKSCQMTPCRVVTNQLCEMGLTSLHQPFGLSALPLLMVRWYKKSTLAGWKQCLPCTLHPAHILHVLYERPASREAGRMLRGMARCHLECCVFKFKFERPDSLWLGLLCLCGPSSPGFCDPVTHLSIPPTNQALSPRLCFLFLSVYSFSEPTHACSLAPFLHNSTQTSSHLNQLWERAAPATAAIGKGGL